MARTKEEILKKKREAEKRRRERIKADPVKYAIYKQNEHKKYLKKKEKNQILEIGKLTSRGQRQQRKKWRESQRKCREKKKKAEVRNFMGESSPPIKEDEELVTNQNKIRERNDKIERERSARIQRIRNKKKKERTRKIAELKGRIEKLQNQVYKYKKRYQRKKNKKGDKKDEYGIEDNVNRILQAGPSRVRKELLFGEVLKKQLQSNFKNLRSQKEKHLLSNCLAGKIIKKYKIIRKLSAFCTIKNLGKQNFVRKSRADFKERTQIINFLERDENSRMCPGKKEYARHGRNIKQKRLLTETKKMLHKKYVKEYSSEISYSFFCKNIPFWIK